MTVDQEVGEALRRLTDEVRPLPDAYGRVRVRYRLVRRRRRTLLGLTVIVALLAGWAVSLPRASAPDPASPNISWDSVKSWSRRLAESPPRGAVAQDPAYVRALAAKITDQLHARVYLRDFDVRAVKVLFVDDLGPYRVAMVGLDMRTPRFGWPYAMAWFRAARGADVTQLTRTEAMAGYSDALEPVVRGDFADDPANTIHVAVAPAACRFESAAWPAVADWRPEPTGSYLVRTPQDSRAEWWRVVCDGRVRQAEPAPMTGMPPAHTEADLTAQLHNARGQITRTEARQALTDFEAANGYTLAGPGRLVWGGRVSWPGHGPGKTLVVAAPSVHGGWVGMATLTFDKPDAQGSLAVGGSFMSGGDPSRRASMSAIALEDEAGHTVLLIVPAGTSSVRIREDGNTKTVPVTGSGIVVSAANPRSAAFTALDGNGKELARTSIAQPGSGVIDTGDNWTTP